MLAGLAPVFLLILLGLALKRAGFPGDAFWPAIERLTYYLFFPALLVGRLAATDLGALQVGPMAVAMVGAVLLASAAVLGARRALAPRLKLSAEAYGSLYQGCVRPNTYVALAAGAALFDDAGITLVAVGIATVVPAVNVLSVAALVRLHGAGAGWGTALGQIFRNPLILAVLAGWLLNVSGVGLPGLAGALVGALGQAALPLALLAVGAGLDFAALRRAHAALWLSAAVKLALLPALTALAALALGLDGLTFTIAVLYNAMPPASSAFVLARQLGGDAELMAGIITGQTLLAFLTLPAILVVFG